MTPEKIWKMVLSLLEKTLQPVTISAWFDDLTAIQFKNNTLHLHTPDEFKKEMIDDRYITHIKDALKNLFSDDIDVIITTGESTTEIPSNDEPNDEYTFDNFIVGSSNKFAYTSATAVAKKPARIYNPLFIHGPSGLGKTHLLYAISSFVRHDHPSYRIVYIKGEDFTNELINAIGEGQVQEFRNKYRQADLLLVDDIQFIAGKERTQEEFFHTFNALHEAHKQIVLTSDRPPREIRTLEERLRTRFESGLLSDIQPPDYETRAAIINTKAKSLGVEIPNEIVDYIATTITSNVRQLEGTIKKIKALHELMGRRIDMELAKEAIADIFKENPGLNPTPEMIIQEVSNFYSIPVDKLKGSGRSRDMVQPRQIAMYLTRQMTDYSLPEIGKVFSRDHTTVLHSINKIESHIKDESDPLENDIKIIQTNIRGGN